MANYENISRNRDLPILIKEYEDFSRELLNQNAFLKWLESISALDCVRSMETVKSFKYENDMNLEILKRIEGLK